HDHRLVPRPGPDPPGRPSPCVTNFRKPPWYVERMPGGVGGGNREEPAYPIESGLHQRDRADSRTKSAHLVNLIWRDLLWASKPLSSACSGSDALDACREPPARKLSQLLLKTAPKLGCVDFLGHW